MKQLGIFFFLIFARTFAIGQDSSAREIDNFINSIFMDSYQYIQAYSVEEGLQNVDSTKSLLISALVDTMSGPYILPKEICKLKNLIQIAIECNNRVTIPKEIECLSNLRAFWTISTLTDSDIPTSIENCSNLEFIGFGGENQFTHIPEGVFNLPKLKYFELTLNSSSNNQILFDLYRLTEIKELKYVYLDNFKYSENEKQKLITHLQNAGIEIGFSL